MTLAHTKEAREIDLGTRRRCSPRSRRSFSRPTRLKAHASAVRCSSPQSDSNSTTPTTCCAWDSPPTTSPTAAATSSSTPVIVRGDAGHCAGSHRQASRRRGRSRGHPSAHLRRLRPRSASPTTMAGVSRRPEGPELSSKLEATSQAGLCAKRKRSATRGRGSCWLGVCRGCFDGWNRSGDHNAKERDRQDPHRRRVRHPCTARNSLTCSIPPLGK